MGRKLTRVKVDDGIYLNERACEYYCCRSCGSKMISVNFVNGLCIQVFSSHGPECEFFQGNPGERTVDVTCETCAYYDSGCSYEGEINSRITSVRAEAV